MVTIGRYRALFGNLRQFALPGMLQILLARGMQMANTTNSPKSNCSHSNGEHYPWRALPKRI